MLCPFVYYVRTNFKLYKNEEKNAFIADLINVAFFALFVLFAGHRISD